MDRHGNHYLDRLAQVLEDHRALSDQDRLALQMDTRGVRRGPLPRFLNPSFVRVTKGHNPRTGNDEWVAVFTYWDRMRQREHQEMFNRHWCWTMLLICHERGAWCTPYWKAGIELDKRIKQDTLAGATQ